MFKLAELKTQLIIAGIMGLMIIGLGWSTKHYYDSNLKNELRVEEVEQINKDLQKTITFMEKAKVIDNTIIADQRKIIDNLTTNSDGIRTGTVTAVERIMKKYSNMPQTPENTRLRDVEVSTRRMMDLWKSFCLSRPGYKECELLAQEGEQK